MNVLNIHTREINKPKGEILNLFATLSQKDDKMWPWEKWPPMKFKNGLTINSEGGHGPIRYIVVDYNPEEFVEFEFQKPNGFNGRHKFEIVTLSESKTEIKHTIKMKTAGSGTLAWIFAIRWLHDALLEDAFDKIENQLCNSQKKSAWNPWVKLLRRLLAA